MASSLSYYAQQQPHYITPTEDSTLLSGVHGRQRRQERNIRKLDLQRARRYGMSEPAKNGRIKYTYAGVVFIYDPKTNREVTSFPAPDKFLATSGTTCSDPVLLSKVPQFDTEFMKRQHQFDCRRVFQEKEKWKSHSVLVVDMSGSMRRDDVSGARCRSDGVWMIIARDFVKQQLDTKLASLYDVVSVVVMQDDAMVMVRCEPMDWVLYNKLLDFREWTTMRPSGPGNYMPALERAEQLLDINPLGSCSLSILFFSDGKPSDRGDFRETMGQMAAKYRRRLTVTCVGMADEQEESFDTLTSMVEEAESYGAVASFHKPTLSTDSLSNVMSSLVTSLTSSRTELTDMATGNSRIVRTDVKRERNDAPDDIRLTHEWETYRNNSNTHYVCRIWSWDHKKNDFILLMDPRCIFCYKLVGRADWEANDFKGFLCPKCEACYICFECKHNGKYKAKHYLSEECHQWLKDRRNNKILRQPITSFSVAMKKPIFGEGVERIVHKFRFLDDEGNFVGPKMVAKESRFVDQGNRGTTAQKMDYVREFMRTQALASEFARKFNDVLDSLVDHFAKEHYDWIRKFPRIHFLEPMVVEAIADGLDYNFLIEKMLEGKYEKYNSNMGMVKGQAGNVPKDELNGLCAGLGAVHLGAIEEGDSEDEDEEDSDDEGGVDAIFDRKESTPVHGVYQDVRDEDFPQAFSHFTYEKSNKNLMVVDLQGIFSIQPDGSRQYWLTDPVIHKKKRVGRQGAKSRPLRNWNFGRTDRGEQGMTAFWATHQCTDACRLLGLEEHKNVPPTL
jgi:hypothetical protein